MVTVPSDALRQQVGGKFFTLGLLKEFEIINKQVLYPRVGILYNGIQTRDELNEFIEKSNVIITTMPLITSMAEELQTILADKCSQIFVDEAHHIKAGTWDSFRKSFLMNR